MIRTSRGWPLDLVRTNLGKWGKVTQTFYEHGYAVYVFRKVLNYPAEVLLHKKAKDQRLMKMYRALVFLESMYHDYDKLYVPRDMLDPDEMKKFEGHGDISSERNKKALELTLREVKELILGLIGFEEGDSDKWMVFIPRPGILEALREIVERDVGVIADVLRSANASHEGMRTPEKLDLVVKSLESFFKLAGWDLDLKDVARIHLLSLRAADSIASAWEGRPSFKSDVTEIVESMRQVLELDDPTIHVTSVYLNPALMEARSPKTLISYLRIYDEVRSLLENWMRDANGLERGILVEDNSSLISAMWLGSPDERFDPSVGLPDGVREDVFQVRNRSIRMTDHRKDFDLELRNVLLESLTSGYVPVAKNGPGIPCSSCGRSGRLVSTGDVEAMFGRRISLDDFSTVEKMGKYGYISAVGHLLYGVDSRISHNHRPVCATCLTLFERAQDVKIGRKIPITVIFSGFRREVEARSDICSPSTDPLVERLYTYALKEQVIRKFISETEVLEQGKRYGISVVHSFISRSTVPEILMDQISLITKEEDLQLGLVCGEVIYKLEWGMRIGLGPISPGYVWDHELLKGVWTSSRYMDLLRTSLGLVEKLSSIMSRDGVLTVLSELPGLPSKVNVYGSVLRRAHKSKLPRNVELIEKLIDDLDLARRERPEAVLLAKRLMGE